MIESCKYPDWYAVGKEMEPDLKLINAISLANCRFKTPDINVYPDGVQFFNPFENEIHLGTDGVIDMFHPKNKAEFRCALEFLQEHEEEHRRSTPSEIYDRSIKRGTQAVIEEIALKVEGKKRRFRNDRDYFDYLSIDLKKAGYYVPKQAITKIVSGIANSIEDGRIERGRSAKYPGFEQHRRYFRGIFWNSWENPYMTPDEVMKNPGEKLRLMLNGILSLATCQVYPKGFLIPYAGTAIQKELDSLMPFIARGIMASKFRDAEVEIIEISRRLGLLIFETVKRSASEMDAMTQLMEIAETLLQAILESSLENGLSERDEEQIESSANTTFPGANLVLEVDDETYDKLTKGKKKGESSGSGLMIKRKNPRKEDTDLKEPSNEKNGSEDPTEAKDLTGKDIGDTAKGAQNPWKEQEESKGPAESGETSETMYKDGRETEKNHSGKSEKGKPLPPMEKGKQQNAAAIGSETSSSSGSNSQTGNPKTGSDQEVKKNQKSDNASDLEEQVQKSIEESKKMSVEKAAEFLRRNTQAEAHKKKMETGLQKDKDEVLKNEEVKGSMDSTMRFEETKRTYEVDAELPPVLKARGKALHRKLEKFFQGMKTPNVRHLTSGELDPDNLCGLAMGVNTVFRRVGKDKSFDGCAYLLIDNSGSMSGGKFSYASSAAAVIEEGFRGLMPVKITGFTSKSGKCIHRRIKGWEESLQKNCVWSFHEHWHAESGNADGCSVGVATQELLKRPERKKLLVVISDGMPTDGSSDPVKHVQRQVALARKRHVQVVGIYITEEEYVNEGEAKVFHSIYGTGLNAICTETKYLDQALTSTFDKFARS
ncbi:MAG: hypothetical protein Q4B26_00880 [Eubacteriales bacterium]|nr:hypothetical protein [Eubacteriales bacterium]